MNKIIISLGLFGDVLLCIKILKTLPLVWCSAVFDRRRIHERHWFTCDLEQNIIEQGVLLIKYNDDKLHPAFLLNLIPT